MDEIGQLTPVNIHQLAAAGNFTRRSSPGWQPAVQSSQATGIGRSGGTWAKPWPSGSRRGDAAGQCTTQQPVHRHDARQMKALDPRRAAIRQQVREAGGVDLGRHPRPRQRQPLPAAGARARWCRSWLPGRGPVGSACGRLRSRSSTRSRRRPRETRAGRLSITVSVSMRHTPAQLQQAINCLRLDIPMPLAMPVLRDVVAAADPLDGAGWAARRRGRRLRASRCVRGAGTRGADSNVPRTPAPPASGVDPSASSASVGSTGRARCRRA